MPQTRNIVLVARRARAAGPDSPLAWSVVWVALALVFNYGFNLYAVAQHGQTEGARLASNSSLATRREVARDNIFGFVVALTAARDEVFR